MSTFFGGEQLVNTVQIDNPSSGGQPAATIYTCPSGRYAEVTVKSNSNGADITYLLGALDTVVAPTEQYTFLMNAGESIERVAGVYQYNFFIKEYKLP